MAKVDIDLSEATGLLVEEPGKPEAKEPEKKEAAMPEKGRKGGEREEMMAAPMPEEQPRAEECEGMELDHKQSIGDLTCGRITKK